MWLEVDEYEKGLPIIYIVVSRTLALTWNLSIRDALKDRERIQALLDGFLPECYAGAQLLGMSFDPCSGAMGWMVAHHAFPLTDRSSNSDTGFPCWHPVLRDGKLSFAAQTQERVA